MNTKQFSDETGVSPELAKRIIDNLEARGLDVEKVNWVIHEIKE